MIKIKVILFFILLVNTLFGQQAIDPYMIEIPKNKIKYYNDGIKAAEVANFYISQYPESVEQYKVYLRYLEEEDRTIEFNNALPKIENLKKCFLSPDVIQFIRGEYLKNEVYNQYPIIGLDLEQIEDYLNWKINTFGKHIFSINGYDIKDQSYADLMQKHRDTINFKYPISYKIAFDIHLISALESIKNGSSIIPNDIDQFPTILRRKANLNHKKVKNKILDNLNICNIYKYDLLRKNKYKNIKETILGIDNFKLKVIKRKKGKSKIFDSALKFIRPWRTSGLKINV